MKPGISINHIKVPSLVAVLKRPGIRSLGLYTFTNFFGKGVSFLLLPYFTHVLTRSDMGMLSLFGSAIICIIPFVSMGVLQSASADFFKMNKEEFKDYFTTSLMLPVIVTLIAFILFYCFRHWLEVKYHFPPTFAWLIPLIAFLTFIREHIVNMIRNNHEPKLFMGVVLGRLLLELGLAVLLISVVKWGWEGRVSGILASYAVLTVFSFYYFIKKGYLFGKIKKQVIKTELIYSIPIITMQFGIFCLNSSDSFFLSRFTNDGNAEVGVYAIACVFASILLALCSALIQYVFPRIYSLLAQPVIDYQQIRKHFLLYGGLMTAALIFLLLFVPLAYHKLINKAYAPGLKYYYFLCIGYYFWAITYFFYSFLLYYKQKKEILLLSITSIIISLGCNYFMIKYYTSFGAAVSVCISYLFILLITLWVTRKQMGFVFKKQSLPETQYTPGYYALEGTNNSLSMYKLTSGATE